MRFNLIKTRLKILITATTVLVIAGVGFLIFWKRGSFPTSDSLVSKSINPVSSKNNSAPSLPRSKLSKTYSNSELGLSFNYPEGFNVSSFAEGEAGFTILVQKPNTKESFQFFISDFDEPGPITTARIKKDVPDMVIENPQEVLIGSGKNLPALIFFSRNESLGRTREVRFVVNAKLYQLTTYANVDNLIGPVLETLTFKYLIF